jgi:hypothetical protein
MAGVGKQTYNTRLNGAVWSVSRNRSAARIVVNISIKKMNSLRQFTSPGDPFWLQARQ